MVDRPSAGRESRAGLIDANTPGDPAAPFPCQVNYPRSDPSKPSPMKPHVAIHKKTPQPCKTIRAWVET